MKGTELFSKDERNLIKDFLQKGNAEVKKERGIVDPPKAPKEKEPIKESPKPEPAKQSPNPQANFPKKNSILDRVKMFDKNNNTKAVSEGPKINENKPAMKQPKEKKVVDIKFEVVEEKKTEKYFKSLDDKVKKEENDVLEGFLGCAEDLVEKNI